MLETTIIIISALIIFLIYFARYKNNGTKTFLFSNAFLEKADDLIFTFIKFVFKMTKLVFQNIKSFIVIIPHNVLHIVHVIAKKLTYTTHALKKRFKKPEDK